MALKQFICHNIISYDLSSSSNLFVYSISILIILLVDFLGMTFFNAVSFIIIFSIYMILLMHKAWQV